mmetsp:Transcript_21341/g.17751  ORF Transcript_21341/g.17751 Transcript_21341/m.17751 type:complete len:90 (+) Transcript_21341:72-341(+)
MRKQDSSCNNINDNNNVNSIILAGIIISSMRNSIYLNSSTTNMPTNILLIPIIINHHPLPSRLLFQLPPARTVSRFLPDDEIPPGWQGA